MSLSTVLQHLDNTNLLVILSAIPSNEFRPVQTWILPPLHSFSLSQQLAHVNAVQWNSQDPAQHGGTPPTIRPNKVDGHGLSHTQLLIPKENAFDCENKTYQELLELCQSAASFKKPI